MVVLAQRPLNFLIVNKVFNRRDNYKTCVKFVQKYARLAWSDSVL